MTDPMVAAIDNALENIPLHCGTVLSKSAELSLTDYEREMLSQAAACAHNIALRRAMRTADGA